MWHRRTSADQSTFDDKREFDQMARKDTIDAKLEPGEFVVHPKALQFYVRLYKASEKKKKKLIKKN